MSCVAPTAAFYAMPTVTLPPGKTDEQFIVGLLRATGVLCVYGSGFGTRPEDGFFRVVFLASPQDLRRIYAADRRVHGRVPADVNPTRSRWFDSAWRVSAVYALVTLATTWPLVAHLTTSLPADLGDPLLNSFILAVGHRSCSRACRRRHRCVPFLLARADVPSRAAGAGLLRASVRAGAAGRAALCARPATSCCATTRCSCRRSCSRASACTCWSRELTRSGAAAVVGRPALRLCALPRCALSAPAGPVVTMAAVCLLRPAAVLHDPAAQAAGRRHACAGCAEPLQRLLPDVLRAVCRRRIASMRSPTAASGPTSASWPGLSRRGTGHHRRDGAVSRAVSVGARRGLRATRVRGGARVLGRPAGVADRGARAAECGAGSTRSNAPKGNFSLGLS